MMRGLPKELPKTFQEWHSAVGRRNLANETIFSANLASASNIGIDQFLLLRVLWRHKGPRAIYSALEIQNWITRATEILDDYRSWSTYCDSFGSS